MVDSLINGLYSVAGKIMRGFVLQLPLGLLQLFDGLLNYRVPLRTTPLGLGR